MSLMIHPDPSWKTDVLLATILNHALQGNRVRFLVERRGDVRVMQRLRTALSRSRDRNRRAGNPITEFTMKSESFPFTDSSGKQHTCLVVWVEKNKFHVNRELLDDVMERRINVT